jgi:hypothetical protein
MSDKFEEVHKVPLEHVWLVVSALLDHCDAKLEKREHFYGEPEYRVVAR